MINPSETNTGEKLTKNRSTRKKQNKMDAIIQNISIITLNLNKLNTPVKRLRLSVEINIEHPNIYCI